MKTRAHAVLFTLGLALVAAPLPALAHSMA